MAHPYWTRSILFRRYHRLPSGISLWSETCRSTETMHEVEMNRSPAFAVYGDLFKKCVDDAEDKVGKDDLVVQGSADNVGPDL